MSVADDLAEYPYCYRWRNNEVRARFYGRRCRVLARCRFNTVVLMFEDGEKLVTSGNALRRWERDREKGS